MFKLVGKYNVELYPDPNIGQDGKYYNLCVIIEFDRNEKQVAQQSIYFQCDNFTEYQIASRILDNRRHLKDFMQLPRNTKLKPKKQTKYSLENLYE